MANTAEALRETSDALLLDLQALAELEEAKRAITPGDPRLIELAATVEALAERVLATSARQRELSLEANDLVELGLPDAPDRPIAETPRSISTILAEWREAERRVLAATTGSAEEAEGEAVVRRLKAEYRQAHEAASRSVDA